MCEKYGIDDKTRFLVLYFDARMGSTEISRIINRSQRTLKGWIRRIKKGEDIRINKKRGGDQRNITAETGNKVIQLVKENPEGSSLNKLAARIGISRSSVRRVLAKNGFKYKAFDKGFIYSEEERMKRVDFCKGMLLDEGKAIYQTFFSDEMAIELNNNYKNKVWQLLTENIRRKNATEYVKLNCWGAISAKGATSLDIYERSLNGNFYRQIITGHKEEMKKLYSDGEEFYFLQDNHPAHRKSEQWLVEEQKLNLIKLPKRSPDLNIIENLWSALKERVISEAPSNEKELRASLLSHWEVLTKADRLQPFFEGLHRRYMECIERDGHKFRY